MILDFDEIDEYERVDKAVKALLHSKPTKKMPNKIKMPKPKKTLWDRFISLFR
jgi:hypothetical protein